MRKYIIEQGPLSITDMGAFLLVEFFGKFSVEAVKQCVDSMAEACGNKWSLEGSPGLQDNHGKHAHDGQVSGGRVWRHKEKAVTASRPCQLKGYSSA